MSGPSIQPNVEALIHQLDEEVRKLFSLHHAELMDVLEGNPIDTQKLNDQFEKRLLSVQSGYRSKIKELAIEIDYLRELNMAQRLMMEDTLVYLRFLEEKITPARPVE